MGIFDKIKRQLSAKKDDYKIPEEKEYVEIDVEQARKHHEEKVVVRPFTMTEFDDLKDILAAIRDGYTISLINIRPLRDKNIGELKRAIAKIKKTLDAVGGDIAGFGEDWIAVVPSFAHIYREPLSEEWFFGFFKKRNLFISLMMISVK